MGVWSLLDLHNKHNKPFKNKHFITYKQYVPLIKTIQGGFWY